MGFIKQSNTKKIYAYLTQYARQQILDGDEKDITVKYFSLHDDDVNYNISANIVNNSYNTLPSGFIPDITGDNQGCLFSISKMSLKNAILTPQPIPKYFIVPDKTNVFETESVTYTITTENVADGTILYWSFLGSASAADFTENTDNGSVTIISNTANFTLNVIQDNITESDETVIMYLKDGTGITLAVSTTVFLKDKTFPPASAEVITECGVYDVGLFTGEYANLLLYVSNPTGGSGGPYKWKVVAVDSLNNPFIGVLPINSPSEWADKQTIFNEPENGVFLEHTTSLNSADLDLYYNVYLYDSADNEYFIKKTTICIIKNVIITPPSDIVISSNVVGTQNITGNNQITLTPSATASFDLNVNDEGNLPLTSEELSNIIFRFEKVNPTLAKWGIINFKLKDFPNQPSEIELNNSLFLNFESATTTDSINYKLPIKFKVERTSVGQTKPVNSAYFMASLSDDFFEFNIFLNSPNISVSNTFKIYVQTWEWLG
jgi:hypothetical protein